MSAMIIRLLLIFSYILSCIRLRVAPYKYFQLNSDYFNEQRDIFSKLDMDRLIPDRWRLMQFMDIGDQYPVKYPVFVKPEWGQNSRGVQRADNRQALEHIRANRTEDHMNYLIQQAAPGKREFEVFIIPSSNPTQLPAILSVTETVNRSGEQYPINGIYNKSTHYLSISNQLNTEQMSALWAHLKQIGPFRISRFGLRADSVDALLKGEFHIVEINLYLPMPLALLADNLSKTEKYRLCLRCMWQLANITKTLPANHPHKPVFFKNLRLSRSLKLSNKIGSYNEHI